MQLRSLLEYAMTIFQYALKLVSKSFHIFIDGVHRLRLLLHTQWRSKYENAKKKGYAVGISPPHSAEELVRATFHLEITTNTTIRHVYFRD